jgi:anti-sigma factor RsiW
MSVAVVRDPEVRTKDLSCAKTRIFLPGYLDGALPADGGRFTRASIHAHLQRCAECSVELSRYQKMQQLLAKTEPAAAPKDLGIEIRMALARAREASNPSHWLRRIYDRADLMRQNILAPLVLPVTGGLVSALMVFTLVLPSYAGAGPLRNLMGVIDEMPAISFQPARLDMLAELSVAGLGASASSAGGVVVEATVGVDGDVVDYRILAGPDNPEIRRRLDQILLLSRFHPEVSFGRRVAGGRVVMSFITGDVKG